MAEFEGGIEAFPEFQRSRAELLDRARQLAWYHSLRLDDSLTTEGYFTLDPYVPYYLMPESLEGLDCLEIGAGNGYWSFLMERRGARSVTATDIGAYIDTDFSRLHGQPPLCTVRTIQGEYGEPYRVAATLLGSRVQYRICSVYDLRPEEVGEHDVVFCGSMLMHLFAPLLALQRIASVCRNTLLLTTQTELALDGESVTVFAGHEIPFVHFLPSPSCLVNMVRCCGYERVLRGPTFHLRRRDQKQDPSPLVHTSLIALKDAAHPAIALPAPRLYRESERAARIEVVSGPRRVAPGQAIDLVVRVENASGVPWRGDGKTRLGLDYELHAAERRGTVVSGSRLHRSGLPFVDYLPAGLSTLARLRLTAPARSGAFRVRPVVVQGGQRFGPGDAVHEVVVDAAFRGPRGARGRRWLGPVLDVMRRAPGYRVARSAAKKLLSRLP